MADKLVDRVVCITCDSYHEPFIPTTTFNCYHCSFSMVDDEAAAQHVDNMTEAGRDHLVYVKHHLCLSAEMWDAVSTERAKLLWCPTCGPTTTEAHPRLSGVTRCSNCKEHLTTTS